MRRRYPADSRFAISGSWLGRGLRSWGGVAAVALACSLLASSAQAVAPAALTRDGAAGWLLSAGSPTAGSPTPVAQLEDQAADRAHRIGQERPVLVHRLVAEDTVEQRMLTLQEKKRALADAATHGAEAAFGLTRQDLLALLG